jgi:hypothetical protein
MRGLCVTLDQFEDEPPAWRVNLPSYIIIEENYPDGKAIIEVPDADFPVTSIAEGQPGFEQIGERFVLTQQTELEKSAWLAKLNRRYRWPLARMVVSVVPWFPEG